MRPDGALFPLTIALACVGVRATEHKPARPFVLLALPALAFAAAQLAFRRAYYGETLPNTAHVKLGGWQELHTRGLEYVQQGLLGLSPLLVVAVCGVVASVRDRELRRRVAVCAVPLVVWLLYEVRIGGDIFPGHRHQVPTVVLLAFMGAAFVGRVSMRHRPSKLAYARAALAIGGSSLALGWLGWLQNADPQNINARTERWEWTCKRIAEAMGRAYGEHAPLAAVDPAGCFPYWSRLPSLDMLGLNDRFIATHPPRTRWRYHLGHDLGNAGYVLRARPDIVVLCDAFGRATGCFPSGVGMTGDPSFHRDYRLVTYELPEEGLRWQHWVRFASGPLAPRVTPGSIAMPAHFFTASSRKITFDRAGRACVRGDAEAPFRLEAVNLPVGRWRLTYEASGPIAEARVYRGDAAPDVVRPDETFVATGDAESVDVELVPALGETLLYSMTLERAER